MKPNQYIPFARKYRPSSFSELYGQEILTRVITSAILNNRLSQSYLLTGIRGVGKTTSARIIAKTINCTSQIKSELSNSKSVSPCNQCQNCLSFNDYRHPDVIEVDAASKTGVDDIRSIIESSEYQPLLGQYKVFIIDEVHMLSKSAFNALLKVIEEPPAHIIFIFATTEVQKMPLTVISRCQRYDLRRLSVDEILELLKNMAASENLQIKQDALRIIANKSEGSARDAVVLLDQAASLEKLENREITTDMINSMLGLIKVECIIEFVQCIVSRDVTSTLNLINKIYLSSHDLECFIQSTCEFIAYLTKLKVTKNYSAPIYEPYTQSILKIVDTTDLAQLSLLWQIFSKGAIEVKTSHNQLICTEMLIIKAIYAVSLPSIEEILSQNITNPRQCQEITK